MFRRPIEIPGFSEGEEVEVTINQTARKSGERVRGIVISVGFRQSLVQLEHYKVSFWNDEIKPVKGR